MINVTSHILGYLKEKVIMVTYSGGGEIHALLCKIERVLGKNTVSCIFSSLYIILRKVLWGTDTRIFKNLEKKGKTAIFATPFTRRYIVDEWQMKLHIFSDIKYVKKMQLMRWWWQKDNFVI